MSKHVLLCGYFAFGSNDNGGQPVKSRELYNALKEYYGESAVTYVETLNWKRHPLHLLCDYFFKAKKADCIVMLPAQNGVKVFSRLLLLAKQLWKKRIYYSVIGGWLAKKTETEPKLRNILLKFDGIWSETTSMKEMLVAQKFNNVCVIPNFKHLKINTFDTHFDFSVPYRLCYFARVIKEKGIEDAINAVTELNRKYGITLCSLDIYGQIDNRYADDFTNLQADFPKYIKYLGMVDALKSVDTISGYYALLFPTHYYTEGIPGTLIDALCAGVPVVSSNWANSKDILFDKQTGFSFEFGSYDSFVAVLDDMLHLEHDKWLDMKKQCLQKAELFTPEHVISVIDDQLAEK